MSEEQSAITSQETASAPPGGTHRLPAAPRWPAWEGDMQHDRNDLVFSPDASQRWALGSLIVLALVLGGVLYATFRLLLDATGLPTPLGPWVEVGLVSLAGAVLEAMWGVGYHGFIKKDFDPESSVFLGAKLAGAPFVTLAALGATDLVLPADLGLAVPGEVLSPLTVALAFLLGYHSADLLDLVHLRMSKLLGKTPKPLIQRPLPKSRLYPLDALVDHPRVARPHGPGLRGNPHAALRALRRNDVYTTTELLALQEADVDRITRDAELDPAALGDLRKLAEALSNHSSLAAGATAFRLRMESEHTRSIQAGSAAGRSPSVPVQHAVVPP